MCVGSLKWLNWAYYCYLNIKMSKSPPNPMSIHQNAEQKFVSRGEGENIGRLRGSRGKLRKCDDDQSQWAPGSGSSNLHQQQQLQCSTSTFKFSHDFSSYTQVRKDSEFEFGIYLIHQCTTSKNSSQLGIIYTCHLLPLHIFLCHSQECCDHRKW